MSKDTHEAKSSSASEAWTAAIGPSRSAAGALRLIQLAGSAEIIPARARFDAAPLPVALHIVSAFVYALLGAF